MLSDSIGALLVLLYIFAVLYPGIWACKWLILGYDKGKPHLKKWGFIMLIICIVSACILPGVMERAHAFVLIRLV